MSVVRTTASVAAYHVGLASLLTAVMASLAMPAAVVAAPLQVDWITRYPNEELQVAHLADPPRMLRNISNSLMIVAPAYLEGATYLQRRTSPWEGIDPELSKEWLRPDRVSLSKPAVAIVAVREPFYPGAGSLLTSLGWTALGDTIKLNYVSDPAQLTLYAGLVDAGAVHISGKGVELLLDEEVANSSWHHYFFFQETTAFSPQTLAQFRSVNVPEPGTCVMLGTASVAIFLVHRRRRPKASISTRQACTD